MKHYTTIHIEYDKEVISKISCDLCGAETLEDANWDTHEGWVDKVTIQYDSGRKDPEYANYWESTVDLCPSCFREVLIPFLEERGVEVQEKQIEW